MLDKVISKKLGCDDYTIDLFERCAKDYQKVKSNVINNGRYGNFLALPGVITSHSKFTALMADIASECKFVSEEANPSGTFETGFKDAYVGSPLQLLQLPGMPGNHRSTIFVAGLSKSQKMTDKKIKDIKADLRFFLDGLKLELGPSIARFQDMSSIGFPSLVSGSKDTMDITKDFLKYEKETLKHVYSAVKYTDWNYMKPVYNKIGFMGIKLGFRSQSTDTTGGFNFKVPKFRDVILSDGKNTPIKRILGYFKHGNKMVPVFSNRDRTYYGYPVTNKVLSGEGNAIRTALHNKVAKVFFNSFGSINTTFRNCKHMSCVDTPGFDTSIAPFLIEVCNEWMNSLMPESKALMSKWNENHVLVGWDSELKHFKTDLSYASEAVENRIHYIRGSLIKDNSELKESLESGVFNVDLIGKLLMLYNYTRAIQAFYGLEINHSSDELIRDHNFQGIRFKDQSDDFSHGIEYTWGAETDLEREQRLNKFLAFKKALYAKNSKISIIFDYVDEKPGKFLGYFIAESTKGSFALPHYQQMLTNIFVPERAINTFARTGNNKMPLNGIKSVFASLPTYLQLAVDKAFQKHYKQSFSAYIFKIASREMLKFQIKDPLLKAVFSLAQLGDIDAAKIISDPSRLIWDESAKEFTEMVARSFRLDQEIVIGKKMIITDRSVNESELLKVAIQRRKWHNEGVDYFNSLPTGWFKPLLLEDHLDYYSRGDYDKVAFKQREIVPFVKDKKVRS
jgi:hypothetical protein